MLFWIFLSCAGDFTIKRLAEIDYFWIFLSFEEDQKSAYS
jgi:hypothetical protein